MSKEKKATDPNVVTIDFTVWTTIAEKARLDCTNLGTLSKRIERTRKGTCSNPIEFWDIPQLGSITKPLTLVKILG